MFASLVKPTTVSKAQHLTKRIQRYIVDNNVRPGMRLPSERELAEQLEVSRSSVREALRELEAIGLVEKQLRSGTYVRDASAEMLASVAHGWRNIDDESIQQIFEMRILFEPGCAGLAAVRATEDNLHQLREAIEAMAAAAEQKDVVAFQRTDKAFHQAITQATRNPHLMYLINGVMSALEQSIQVSLHVPGQMDRALVGHRQILIAIENRQTVWASVAMENHLRDAWHYISKQTDADADKASDGALVQHW